MIKDPAEREAMFSLLKMFSTLQLLDLTAPSSKHRQPDVLKNIDWCTNCMDSEDRLYEIEL